MIRWHEVEVEGLDRVRIQITEDDEVARVTGLDIRGNDITSASMQLLSLTRLMALAAGGTPGGRRPLGRPSGRRGDDFYERVADAYRSAAAETGGRPAVVLAEENGVPVETVRRWVKEARRQGHLSYGRKGRSF